MEFKRDTSVPGMMLTSAGDGFFGLGGGHEWRLTRTFALGPAIDYGAVGLDDWDFGFTNFTAQLNWYL
jgi:hypothetical protein